jgi:hypothetical protein
LCAVPLPHWLSDGELLCEMYWFTQMPREPVPQTE